jgi:hypothetical protein
MVLSHGKARRPLGFMAFQGYHPRLLIVTQLLRQKNQPFGKKNFDWKVDYFSPEKYNMRIRMENPNAQCYPYNFGKRKIPPKVPCPSKRSKR